MLKLFRRLQYFFRQRRLEFIILSGGALSEVSL